MDPVRVLPVLSKVDPCGGTLRRVTESACGGERRVSGLLDTGWLLRADARPESRERPARGAFRVALVEPVRDREAFVARTDEPVRGLGELAASVLLLGLVRDLGAKAVMLVERRFAPLFARRVAGCCLTDREVRAGEVRTFAGAVDR